MSDGLIFMLFLSGLFALGMIAGALLVMLCIRSSTKEAGDE